MIGNQFFRLARWRFKDKSTPGEISLAKSTYWQKIMSFLTIISILFLSVQLYAAGPDRFITKLKLPTGQVIVVAEGDFESRSIGSFSVRLYDAAPVQDETTFFLSGLIHFRDGTIENVLLDDGSDAQNPEIIVIARSVGSGNYLSAYLFTTSKNELFFRSAVEGMPPNADLLAALKENHGWGK